MFVTIRAIMGGNAWITPEQSCTGTTFSVRSVMSGSIETQFSSDKGSLWLSWRSKLTLTFRLAAFRLVLAMARSTRFWNERPKKLDCSFIGLATFLILGELWPRLNGPGAINHTFSRSYTSGSLKRTL